MQGFSWCVRSKGQLDCYPSASHSLCGCGSLYVVYLCTGRWAASHVLCTMQLYIRTYVRTCVCTSHDVGLVYLERFS